MDFMLNVMLSYRKVECLKCFFEGNQDFLDLVKNQRGMVGLICYFLRYDIKFLLQEFELSLLKRVYFFIVV